MKLLTCRNRDRGGTAVVEMAVVLPVFIIVVFGIIEFGRAMMVEQSLANGARLGARRAILEDTTNDEIRMLVLEFCDRTVGATVDVTIAVNGSANTSLSSAARGDLCEVGVSVPFSDVSLLPMPRWMSNATLQSSCTMEHE